METTDGEEINSNDQKSINQIKEKAQLRAEWEREMKANVAMQKYFDGFLPSSVKSFVQTYLQYKVSWKDYGPMYGQMKERQDLHWINTAFEHLGYIQQKKLFDVQCLWRANQLQLEGVQTTMDFMVWERNILACTFIDPVSENDIDMYIQYLQQGNVDVEEYHFFDWQGHKEMIKAYNSDNESGHFPEWYDFSNGRTGKGILMQLPDIRGEQEKFYLGLFHKNLQVENKEKWAESDALRDKRPSINYHDRINTDWFVSTFENKQMQQWYKDHENGVRHLDTGINETVEENVRILLNADELVPIQANQNWKDAIQEAVNNYKTKKLAEALPQAWEQYQFTVDSGIGYPLSDYDMKGFSDQMAKNILKGRELNGEPADFDF